MPILTVLKGRRFEKEFQFEKDHLFVGREEGNDLVLPDASISRVHSKFLKDPGGWSINDLNSTNGVYLNNNKIKEMPLKDGDVLVMGEYTLFFRDLDAAQRSAPTRTDVSYQTLETLFGLTGRFKSRSALNETLEVMVDSLNEIFQAERGLVLLKDPKSGELCDPQIVRHTDETDGRQQVSKTVAQRVMEARKPLLITDVEADYQLRGVKSIATDQVRSIICAPIGPDGEEPLGVVYLDSRVKIRVFTEKDLEMLGAFLGHAFQLIRSSEESSRLERENQHLTVLTRDISLAEHNPDAIVAKSRSMVELLGQVGDLAAQDVTALITGESGTGKELIAKAIHYRSKRAKKPFVAVNLMALPRELIESELFGHEKGAFSGAAGRKIGKFELAEGGTIFLDEVGELSLDIQVKLLRALEERRIYRVGGNDEIPLDIRLISATNREFARAIQAGEFREDLYYRLNVFGLHLPPLRERRDDVPHLVSHYVRAFNRKMGKSIEGVADEAMRCLTVYDWPGNIRELRNVIERAFVVEKDRRIGTKSLPFNLTRDRIPIDAAAGAAGAGVGAEPLQDFAYPDNFDQAQESFEKTFIIESLRRHNGNITQTSKMTGLPRRSLYRKLEKYGIDPKGIVAEDGEEEEEELVGDEDRAG